MQHFFSDRLSIAPLRFHWHKSISGGNFNISRLVLFTFNLNLQSEELAKSIYASNWYDGNVRDRKILMLMRSQRPIVIKAGFNETNLECFTDVKFFFNQTFYNNF